MDSTPDPWLLRRLIDHLPAMVAYWDADARNVVANAAYVEWFGIAPVDLRGMHISEVLGPDVYEQNLPYIEGALAGGVQRFDRTLFDTMGRERHTQAVYVPDLVDGDVAGFFVLVTEVSELVLAERALTDGVARYRALAHSLPGSFVLVFDGDLRFEIADGPALGAFGLSRDTVEGRTIAEVLPDRLDELEPRYRAALLGETSKWDRRLGAKVFTLTSGPVMSGGTVTAGMVFGIDVTADRRRESRDRALHAIARRAAGGASPSEVFTLVAESVIDVFGADHGGVVRFDSTGSAVVMTMSPSLPEVFAENPALRFDSTSATAAVATTGTPQLRRYDEASDDSAGRLYELGIRVGAAAPIVVNGALWGAISLGIRDRHESTVDLLASLAEFADLVSISISNAQAWESLGRLATTDELTQLPNRRVFDEEFERALRDAAAGGRHLSVAIVDLDDFKSVNDRFGHVVGDHVLAGAARAMAGTIRARDLLARLGGEEFGVILHDAGPEAAIAASERLRTALERMPIAGHRVTASVGVHTHAPGPAVPGELVALADRALYRAKADGRNRTRSTVDLGAPTFDEVDAEDPPTGGPSALGPEPPGGGH